MKSFFRSILVACGAVTLMSTSACSDSSLAINPDGIVGEICEGRFVSGESFELCRRRADGALGGFEVFITPLTVSPKGELLLANRVVVGFVEVTQTFDELDNRTELFWQIKSADDTLLQLQEIEDLPEVAELVRAGDSAIIAALDAIDAFVRHYLFNFNTALAIERGRVYGIDDFLFCLGTVPASRDGLCYTLYDQFPAGGADGTLDQGDFKALSHILGADDDGVGALPFSMEQFLACKQETFNTQEDARITPPCAPFDTNGSATVDDVDLRNLLLGELPGNFAPVAIAGDDQEIAAGEIVILNGRDSFDVESGALTYLWEQIAGVAVTLTGGAPAEARFSSPAAGAGAVLKFRLTVTDAGGLSDSDVIEIRIQGQGGAPSDVHADAGANQQVESGQLVTLDASATSGADLTFQWLQILGPPVTLSALDTEQPVFTAPEVSAAVVLRFQVTVSRSGADADTDIVDVTVLPAGE
jgi:hypothetical protein